MHSKRRKGSFLAASKRLNESRTLCHILLYVRLLWSWNSTALCSMCQPACPRNAFARHVLAVAAVWAREILRAPERRIRHKLIHKAGLLLHGE